MNEKSIINNQQINQEISNKIKLEKRKRHQAYTALDYFSSVLSYFDFFSVDAFKIITHAKYLGTIAKQQQITSEFLLIPYFLENSKVFEMLPTSEMRYRFQDVFLRNFCLDTLKINKKEGFFDFLKEKTNLTDSNISFNRKSYSHEVNQILEKAVENALTRFKTPVITAEILFITLLEEKYSKAGLVIQNLFETEMEWYLFRYKLIKHIHNQESKIRSEVSKNQHYFAYLLKTRLTDSEFNRLIDKMELSKGVLYFRNTIINKFLEKNIFDSLSEEIKISIRTHNNRSYSS